MSTKLYKNITNKKIVLPVTFDEIKPGEVYSVSSDYQQPVGMRGLLEITEMPAEEQKLAEKHALKTLKESEG